MRDRELFSEWHSKTHRRCTKGGRHERSSSVARHSGIFVCRRRRRAGRSSVASSSLLTLVRATQGGGSLLASSRRTSRFTLRRLRRTAEWSSRRVSRLRVGRELRPWTRPWPWCAAKGAGDEHRVLSAASKVVGGPFASTQSRRYHFHSLACRSKKASSRRVVLHPMARDASMYTSSARIDAEPMPPRPVSQEARGEPFELRFRHFVFRL